MHSFFCFVSDMKNSIYSELIRSFPGREKQITQLYNYLGRTNEPFPNCIYIYGGSGTGKTAIIKKVLESFAINHAFINLIECYSSKILFESILNQLTGFKIDPAKGQPFTKCDNMMDFVSCLQRCSEEMNLNGSIVVLDKSEQLRQMDYNLLPGFLRMRELCGIEITVILLSEIVFEKYYARANIVQPIKIYFPQYSKEELLNVLMLDYDNSKTIICNNFKQAFEYDEVFFKSYLNTFLSVFHRACRDVSELRHMSKINFIEYCRPIINKELSITDSMALWRRIAPILKNSLEILYLRVQVDNESTQKQITFSKENLAQSLELPFYAKYLLIAAYLASYNPTKEDKKLFMKYQSKKTKTIKEIKAKSKVSEKLNTQLGPKAFSLDRLLAIFYAILDDKVGFNNNLLVQVSSLVELQLLAAISDNFALDGQKYKCIVSFDFIDTISKMVGFSIRKYLCDFNHL